MTRHALLVGTDVYDDPALTALATPVKEADALARLLRDPRCGFFDDVVVLANPTSGELAEAVSVVTSDRRPGDTVLIFISGHGLVSPRGCLYFATTNTRPTLLAGTSVAASFLNEQLEDSFAGSKVLLLDTCYSGMFATGLASKSGFDPQLAAELGRGYVVLTASESTAFAFEGAGSSHFTAAVIRGLRTPEADQDGDGLISTADLYAFVDRETRREAAQRPTYMAAGVTGKVIVAAAAGRPAVVPARPPAPSGRRWPELLRRLERTIEELHLTTRDIADACGRQPDPATDEAPGTVAAFGGSGALYARIVALDPAALTVLPQVTAGREPFVASSAGQTARRDRGWTAIRHQWWSEAHSDLAAAGREEPLDAAAWWGLGVCQAGAGRWDGAADSFARAARYVEPFSAGQHRGAVLLHWAATRLAGSADGTLLRRAAVAAPNCSDLLAALWSHTGDAAVLAWAVRVDAGLPVVAGALGVRGLEDAAAAVAGEAALDLVDARRCAKEPATVLGPDAPSPPRGT
ncbi:caspase family protein [Dactylosporangium sp. NPDC049742]|uniref:caspase family protein n=1 Tax=Dactylosporangium sp. NPDC049742 TaxID=3154737 RepID=UPI003426F2D7